MNFSLFFTVVSIFYVILLTIVYFSNNRVKNFENNIYKVLLFLSLFCCINELSMVFTAKIMDKFPFFNDLIAKSFAIGLMTWVFFLACYSFKNSYTSDSKLEKLRILCNRKSVKYIYFLFVSILAILPINYYFEPNKAIYSYTYGPCIDALYVIVAILIAFSILFPILSKKKFTSKKNIPLITYSILCMITVIIQNANPLFLLSTSVICFVTVLMYFTMENPDVKMINELNKNRLLVNQTIEEKSNFLFQVSNQIKKPINNIIEISNNSLQEDNIELIKQDLKNINNLSHDLAFEVENVMDISTLSMKNIKIVNSKYNLNNLINKILIIKEKELKDGVEFRLNISQNVPEYLYGDSKLLEQVIMSLIDNSIKYTEKGFIELNINTIEKYDMCRLFISIEDSGKGMSIDKVNELLMLDEELNDKDIKRLETKNIDINAIKKVVSKLGGYLTIKSELEHGTEIKIVIDQKIKKEEQVEINNYLNNQNVLVASNNPEYLKNVTKLMERKGYKVENSIYANDVLDRIRLKQKFSYIILDDELDIRAYEVLKELKKDSKFKIPVIIMIDKDVEFIKDHFVEDGFSDCILKSDLKNELDRIFK